MEYLDRMSTNPTQQVLLSLKTVAEQYLAYNFQSYLFDSDYLNYDWAGDNDPDEIPDDKLPPATISADKVHDALGDFWHHYGGISLYYIYKQLDKDIQENVDIMKYVYNNAQLDIASVVLDRCKTGKVYNTASPKPDIISIFTGTKNKKIVDNSELYASASDEIEHDEHIAFQEKVDAL
jgi:hypothetical protein